MAKKLRGPKGLCPTIWNFLDCCQRIGQRVEPREVGEPSTEPLQIWRDGSKANWTIRTIARMEVVVALTIGSSVRLNQILSDWSKRQLLNLERQLLIDQPWVKHEHRYPKWLKALNAQGVQRRHEAVSPLGALVTTNGLTPVKTSWSRHVKRLSPIINRRDHKRSGVAIRPWLAALIVANRGLTVFMAVGW